MRSNDKRKLQTLVTLALAATSAYALAQAPAQPAAQAPAPIASSAEATVTGKPNATARAGIDAATTTLDQRLVQQRAAERAKISADQGARQAGRGPTDRVNEDADKKCSPIQSQLLTVYGSVGNLNAEILLCGAAVLRRKVGQEIGDGWVVQDIQTSHVVIQQGKKLAQIWMPAPKTSEGARDMPAVPALPSLPPLPTNLAPSPVRGLPTPADVTPIAAGGSSRGTAPNSAYWD